jgi:peptide/nickel transport system permease protein
MARLAVKRILVAVPLLFGLLTIVFLISRVAPGDPVSLFLSPTISPNVADELRRQFGLDRPILTQYADWLLSISKGNLGVSFVHQRPVVEVIGQFLPNTVLLAVSAIVIELFVGIFFGAWAARHQGSVVDRLISNATLVVYTLPTFWVGFILLAVFAYALGFLPSSQMHSIDSDSLSDVERIADVAKHLVLPACTIGIPGGAGIARYFRSSLMKVGGEDYILAARSMGLNRRTIFFRHELPNAIAPVITLLGLELGTLLAGAIVTETIFAWPGMGRLTVMAIFSRDYPLILGCTLVSGVVVIVGNLLADLLYAAVDPRVKVPA